MLELVWLIPTLPLAGFLVLALAGRRLGEPASGWLATILLAGSFVASVVVYLGLLAEDGERRFHQTLFTWVPVGELSVDVGFLVDPLSVVMALFVTGVGTLIFLYSIAYMHGDGDYPKFFVYLSLFATSMLLLVLGDNLLLTFLGWEGVGLCSYLLISFWFGEEANAVAGKKAFVTNRIGDWGFMVAMFLAFSSAGTLSYFGEGEGLLEQAETLAPVTVSAIALLLFFGACGKSAQLPLYTWLPDAMAGPTPVSALIHAATMVTAGVYLMTRAAPLLAASYSWVPLVVAWVGVITAFVAATIAVAQNDVKRVLAFSTISQLGFMFLAVGTGAYVAAIFHMVTHAFFKALLFLGAGSVIHGMHEEQDMQRMGALARLMPVTAGTFIVGWLAIAGVPPFSGFWSKDEILLGAWNESPVLWAVALVAALLTGFYMTRQVFLVFFGQARWSDERATPHESPSLILLPLVVLAALAFIGGGLNLPFTHDLEFMARWLAPVIEEHEAHITAATGTKVGLAIVATVGALGGLAAAAIVYVMRRVPADRVERKLFAHGWYYDESITAFMGGPGRAGFDGVTTVDAEVVDGAVNGVAALVRTGGRTLRLAQSGYVRNYGLGLALGALALVALFLVRVGA